MFRHTVIWGGGTASWVFVTMAASVSDASSFAYASRLRPRGVVRPDSHARTVSRATPTRSAT